MRGIALLFSFLIFATGSAFAAEPLKGNIRAGATTKIYGFIFYNRESCTSLLPAKLGRVRTDNANITGRLTNGRLDKGPCKGKIFKSLGVYYTPKRGFRGKDVGSFTLLFPKYIDDTGFNARKIKFEFNVR